MNTLIPSTSSLAPHELTPLALTSLASEINHHHQLACLRAAEAVSHAAQAGKLLLGVKAALPHGEFGAWLAANIDVTARQAQRYMAAALGKPLAVRALASNTTRVSHLTPNDGEALHINRVLGNWQDSAVVVPHAEAPGRFHYAFITGAVGDGGSCTYTRRAVKAEYIALMINRDLSMPEPGKVDIERRAHPGCSTNPFAEEDAASAMDGAPPALHPNLTFVRELVEQFIADTPCIEAANAALFELLDGGDEYEILPLPGDSLETLQANVMQLIALASEPPPTSLKSAARDKALRQRERIGMLARNAAMLLASHGAGTRS